MADINISSSFNRLSGREDGSATTFDPLGDLIVHNLTASNVVVVYFTGTGSLFGTASYAYSTTTASYVDFTNIVNTPTLISSSAQFSSSDNVTFNVITASVIQVDTLHVQTVTASVTYSSGSNVFGSSLTNTQQFTGSVLVTGSVTATSFVGTASWSNQSRTASYVVTANTASYVTYSNIANLPTLVSSSAQVLVGSTVWSSSAQLPSGTVSSSAQILVGSAVWSSSAQLPSGVISSSAQVTMSYANTASYVLNAISASFATTASFATNFNPTATASYAITSATASYVANAFIQNGNAFNQSASFGTTDAFPVRFLANNVEAMRISTNQDVIFGGGAWSGSATVQGRGVMLQKSSNSAQFTALAASGSSGAIVSAVFEGDLAGGSLSSLTPTYLGQNVIYTVRGYDGTTWLGGAKMVFAPTQTWSAGSHATNIQFYTQPSGSSVNGGSEVVRISENGDIVAGGGDWLGSALVVGRGLLNQRSGSGVTSYVGLNVSTGASSNVHFEGELAGGLLSAITTVLSGSSVLLNSRNFDGSVWAGGSQIALTTTQNWSTGSHSSNIRFSTIPSGSTTVSETARFSENGDLIVGGGDWSGTPAILTRGIMLQKSQQSVAVTILNATGSSGGAATGIAFEGDIAGGNLTSPSASFSGSQVAFSLRGYDGSAWAGGSFMGLIPTQTWSAGSHASAIKFLTVASGSTTSVEAMRIDPAGYVGIGKDSPSASLHIAQSVSGQTRLRLEETPGTSGVAAVDYYDGANQRAFVQYVSPSHAVGFPRAGNLELTTSAGTTGSIDIRTVDVSRLYVSSSGQIGVGNQTPIGSFCVSNSTTLLPVASSPWTYFVIQGLVGSGSNLNFFEGNSRKAHIQYNSLTTADVIAARQGNLEISTQSGSSNIDVRPNGASALYISASGDLVVGSGSWQGQSALGGRGLFVQRQGFIAACTLYTVGAATNAAIFEGSIANGTMASPTAITSASRAQLDMRGYDGTTWLVGGAISLEASQTWSAGSHGTFIKFNTQPSGSSNVQGNEVMRISDTGNVGIGSQFPSASLVISKNAVNVAPISGQALLQIVGSDNPGTSIRFEMDSVGTTAGADFPSLVLRRGRGTSMSTMVALNAGDALGVLSFWGSSTTGLYSTSNNGSILVSAAQNWSTGSQATYMAFFTTPSGSLGNTEGMRLDSTGYLGINKTTVTATLDVSGSVLITGSLNVSGSITGSHFGTSSYALTASFLSGTIASSSYATTASYALSSAAAGGVPVGTVMMFPSTASAITSSGTWLRCDNSLLVTSSYPNLTTLLGVPTTDSRRISPMTTNIIGQTNLGKTYVVAPTTYAGSLLVYAYGSGAFYPMYQNVSPTGTDTWLMYRRYIGGSMDMGGFFTINGSTIPEIVSFDYGTKYQSSINTWVGAGAFASQPSGSDWLCGSTGQVNLLTYQFLQNSGSNNVSHYIALKNSVMFGYSSGGNPFAVYPGNPVPFIISASIQGQIYWADANQAVSNDGLNGIMWGTSSPYSGAFTTDGGTTYQPLTESLSGVGHSYAATNNGLYRNSSSLSWQSWNGTGWTNTGLTNWAVANFYNASNNVSPSTANGYGLVYSASSTGYTYGITNNYTTVKQFPITSSIGGTQVSFFGSPTASFFALKTSTYDYMLTTDNGANFKTGSLGSQITGSFINNSPIFVGYNTSSIFALKSPYLYEFSFISGSALPVRLPVIQASEQKIPGWSMYMNAS